jgi:hypothetical protein
MASRERALARVRDPDDREVVLLARIWREKILRDRPELAGHQVDIMSTVAEPDHIEPDPRPGRARYYRRWLGPSRWLLVVVSFEQRPARIITALAMRKDPKRWMQ